jgi:hypothetical protein
MSTRRMIGVMSMLATLGAMAVALTGCGGGGGDTSGPAPSTEVKPVMDPNYKGGAISEEGPGAGTAAKTK